MKQPISTYTSEEIIQQTKNWIYKVVIGLNFCPFAKREMMRDRVRYVVSTKKSLEQVLLEYVEELKKLDADDSIETTLLIYPNSFDVFEDYLDLVELGQQFLEQLDYEGIYQLATFHPDYCFGDVATTDPSNFTNRSPYPILHLLREESIEKALDHYEDPAAIPDKNIALAREKGTTVLQKILLDCYTL